MRVSVLVLSGLLAQAVQIPLFKFNDEQEDITSLITAGDSITTEGEEAVTDKLVDSDGKGIKDDKWKCDVRSWVRAPDLSPSSIIPAETRLSANGSECNQIEKWQVGLRFKERAIVKMKSKSLNGEEFPVKPRYPTFNETSWPRYDYNDIYFVGGSSMNDPWEEHNKKMKEYSEALKNQSLWDVHGSERIVFNITQDLPFSPADDNSINEIRSFIVKVPNTNLPPMLKYDYGMMFGGDGEHILNTESMFEYHHLIHLSNGTVLDFPAGRAGFIPLVPSTIKAVHHDEIHKGAWSMNVDLDSDRLEYGTEGDDDDVDDRRRYGGPTAPACDKENFASFHLQVKSNLSEVVQGQNITLNFTLTRTGNGTEYPSYLQVQSGTLRNVTWAYNFVESEDEYDILIGVQEYSGRNVTRKRNNRGRMSRHGPPIGMLQVTSQRELERNRDISHMSYGYSVDSDRFPLEYGQSRFDIEKEREVGEEEYQFQLEVTIPETLFPSFETTFETFQSILEFRLSTIFLCEPIDPWTSSSSLPNGNEGSEIDKLDDEWTEYKLPPKKNATKLRNGRHLSHTGYIPLNLVIAPLSTTKSREEASSSINLVHYTDPDARAPIILLDESDNQVSFGILGGVHEESEDQLRRSRYSFDRYDRYRPGKNMGGELLHAAKLWQTKERRPKE